MSVKLPFKLIATTILVASVTTGCHLTPGEQPMVKPEAAAHPMDAHHAAAHKSSPMHKAKPADKKAAQGHHDAKHSAMASRAIAAAKSAIKQAKDLDWIWRDTEKFLKKAEAAAKNGDDAKAIKLASKSRKQAEDAVNQYYLEKAKMLSSGLNGVDMSTNQQGAYGQANKAIGGAQGKAAYDILSRLNAELNNKSAQYTVNSGDSLWSISGQSGVYGNPYQWPLIYKANTDKIKDADLIYPGQDLSVNMNPSSDDVNAAVEHAKTRGAWTLGDTESSDDDYLGGTLHVK